MTNITIRIDDGVKKEAESLFEKVGFSISGARKAGNVATKTLNDLEAMEC